MDVLVIVHIWLIIFVPIVPIKLLTTMLRIKNVLTVLVVLSSAKLPTVAKISKVVIALELDIKMRMVFVFVDSRLLSGMVNFVKLAFLLAISILLRFNARNVAQDITTMVFLAFQLIVCLLIHLILIARDVYVPGILLKRRMELVSHALKVKSTTIIQSSAKHVLWDLKILQMDYFVVVTHSINHTLS